MSLFKKPTDPSCLQDSQYQDAIKIFGRDIARFVTGYENDVAKRQELLQEVHVSLWKSLADFKQQCSLRTWVYRIAHNVGVSHVQRNIRAIERQALTLDDAQWIVDERADTAAADRRMDFERLLALIHRLVPLDRELMLLYLEDLDAATISEITGLSARNVATKIHRIKTMLAAQLGNGSNPS